MFFDAFGRLAFGQVSAGASLVVTLPASTGAYVITGNGVTLRGNVAASGGSYVISGSPVVFSGRMPGVSGSYTLSGSSAGFATRLSSAAGSYAITGQPAAFRSKWAAQGGAYTLSGPAIPLTPTLTAISGSYVLTGLSTVTHTVMLADTGLYVITPGYSELRRTGGEYDQVYGGIGHYLEEVQRLKQLDAITRKVPPPVVRQSRPLIEKRQPAPVAKPQPFDFQALADQAIAHQPDGQEQAVIAKRRKQEAEILLLLA
jgi:hypothetical protein